MSQNGVARKSLKSAFRAVIEGNMSKELTKRKHSKNAVTFGVTVNVHGCSKLCSGMPSITVKVSRSLKKSRIYCFNLHSSLDRHPATSRLKIAGFFFTRTCWSNVAVGCPVLLGDRILKPSISSKAPLVPFMGPPGFSQYALKVYDFVISKISWKRRCEVLDVSDADGEPFQDDAVEVKTIISDPEPESSWDIASHTFPTASYLCTIPMEYKSRKYEKFDDDDSGEEHGTNFVCETLTSTGVVAVLDFPTNAHFNKIKENQNILELQNSGCEQSHKIIFHLTPEKNFFGTLYQQWVEKFGKDCKHVLINRDSHHYYSLKDYTVLLKMKSFSPLLFPSINEHYILDASSLNTQNTIYTGVPLHWEAGKELSIEKDGSFVDKEVSKSIESEVLDIDDEGLAVIQKVAKKLDVLKTPDCENYYPRLICLGTGGTHDYAYRTFPTFLLQVDPDNSILLDCGDRTLERITITCGESASQVLSSIKLILLSHSHIDHHVGFVDTLKAIVKARGQQDAKVFCLMPADMCNSYVKFLGNLVEHITLCPLIQACGGMHRDIKLEILQKIGLRDITAVKVDHSVDTYGIAIVLKCGKKIVYSSDTLPMSRELVRQGHQADLLIHDCLFPESGYEVEAKYRSHSWLEGTLATADAMGAKFTLLTHFSPMFPVQPVQHIPEKYSGKVFPAFDFMSVSIADLHKLPCLLPALEEIYKSSLCKVRNQLIYSKRKREKRSKTAEELAFLLENSSI